MHWSFPTIKQNSTAKLVICLLLLATAIRFAYFWESQDNPLALFTSHSTVFDQYRWVSLAQDLMGHHWIGSKPTNYSAGYSYLIAFLFILWKNLNVIFIFQIFFGIIFQPISGTKAVTQGRGN